MKRATISDLSRIISSFDKDAKIVVSDNAGMQIAVTGFSTHDGNLVIKTQQEFPESWFDKDGEIIRGLEWVKEIGFSTSAGDGDFEIHSPINGEYKEITFNVYDGFAVAQFENIGLSYPMVNELKAEEIADMNEKLGGRIKDSGVVIPDDALLIYGKPFILTKLVEMKHGFAQETVDEFNVEWTKGKDRFKSILCALYEKDVKEIRKSSSFEWAKEKSISDVIFNLQSNWDIYVRTYLMSVATEWELELMLDIVKKRIPVWAR